MSSHLDELARLVSAEPIVTGSPDIEAIRRRGRRVERRRRLGTGAVAIAAAAIVAVPAHLLTDPGGSAPSPTGPADDASSATPTGPPLEKGLAPWTLPPGCGSLGCPSQSVPETERVTGGPWVVGGLGDGTEEVIYTIERSGVTVIAQGFRDGDDLRRAALALEVPDETGRAPEVRLSGGLRREGPGLDSYTVVGYATSDSGLVGVDDGSGRWRSVTDNTTMLPGRTVFWFVGGWDETWPAAGPAQVRVRVGRRVCTLTECGDPA